MWVLIMYIMFLTSLRNYGNFEFLFMRTRRSKLVIQGRAPEKVYIWLSYPGRPYNFILTWHNMALQYFSGAPFTNMF